MLEILKAIILDSQENRPETGVPRRMHMKAVKNKAAVCIGVRRAGKSTYLYQVMNTLMNDGVPRENILYLNFFDDRLHNLKGDGAGLVAEAYYSLYPKKKNTEKIYCFFDEIQVVQGWERFVDRLMRTEKCEVYITGSSSAMLSREIATQMRGRALSWEMFPFSFREFLDFKGIKVAGPVSSGRRFVIRKAFEEYFEQGGFPETAGLDRRLRTMIHQEYFHAILFRDLVERHDISHPKALTDLAYRLIDNTASLYTVNKLTAHLKALGHKVPKASVSDYLAWMEDAFFFFTVKLFDASLARREANPKRIYCIDHAMVASVSSGVLVNSGHLLENLIFTALRRTNSEIYYYKTKTGGEVDFIVPRHNSPHLLVQACESMARPQTRKREIKALSEAMADLGVERGTIVTLYEQKRFEVKSGTIEVLPAWRFLLDMPYEPDVASQH